MHADGIFIFKQPNEIKVETVDFSAKPSTSTEEDSFQSRNKDDPTANDAPVALLSVRTKKGPRKECASDIPFILN